MRLKLSLLGRMPRATVRSSSPVTPSTQTSFFTSSDASWSEDDDLLESYSSTHRALQASNAEIEQKITKLKANADRLKRELFLLQRHVTEFNLPVFEIWEADILTRLIEVAHARQRQKLPRGVSIGTTNGSHREMLDQAYINASRRVLEGTLRQLGLSPRYREALLRYDQVVIYRSANPFLTEADFANWLLEHKETKPEKFEFWGKLFPVCYSRTVEESAVLY